MCASNSASVAVVIAVAALVGCRGRETLGGSTPALVSAGAVGDACAADSLRPAAGAPAQGLWVSEQPNGIRVMAMIGPPMADERTLVVTRPVESVEVGVAGDTVRYRRDARVSLEMLPPLRSLGSGPGPPGSAATPHPAATYAVSQFVHLAAYEPCVTSGRGLRIRYLRRSPAGQIVADVLLHRASEQ